MATKRAVKKAKKTTKGASRTTNGSEVQKLKEKIAELESLLETAMKNCNSVSCLKEDGEFTLSDNAVVNVVHYTGHSLSIIIEDPLSRKEAAELGEWLIQYSKLGGDDE